MTNMIARMTLILAVLLPFSANADPVKLKLGFFATDTEMTYVTVIKPFAEAVNKEAPGAVVIDLFPNGALGRDLPQQPQMVLDGVSDIAFAIPGVSPGRFADNGVIELPGLVKDLREATLLYTRVIQANLLRGYDDYFVIGAMGTPPFSMFSRLKMTTLADIKGKKIKASNPTDAQSIKQLGAVPVLMPVNEAPEAIGRGTIDSVTGHLGSFFDFGLDRVTKYDYFIRLGFSPLVLLMNKKKFDSLSPEGQAAIRKYSGDWFAETYIKGYGAYIDELMVRLKSDSKRTTTFPPQAELDQAQALFKPVYDDWLAKNPHNPELFKAVQAEITKLRAAN
jgi:TRAP-type transport system periplasmic protein